MVVTRQPFIHVDVLMWSCFGAPEILWGAQNSSGADTHAVLLAPFLSVAVLYCCGALGVCL
jgi:hypothetical protein